MNCQGADYKEIWQPETYIFNFWGGQKLSNLKIFHFERQRKHLIVVCQ